MANNLEKISPVMVVAVPFPAQSHLNQLLHLSSFISSHFNLPLNYVCSSAHVRQAKLRFPNPSKLTKIHFNDLPLPDFAAPPPTRGGNTNFPTHLQPLMDATLAQREPFFALTKLIASQAKKIVIINDFLMSYVVQDAASLPNVELYYFEPNSAFTSFTMARDEEGAAFPIPEGIEFPDKIPSMEGCLTEEFMKFVAFQMGCLHLRVGDIQNTCRVLEGDYVDLLASIQNKVRWAVGPLNELGSHKEDNSSKLDGSKCLDWLDKQPPNSVIYLSFGTTNFFTQDQIRELAIGLEESKIRFIWALKDADKVDIFTKEDGSSSGGSSSSILGLPKGFEERTERIGMILKEWAPQVEILNHPSTGGFMSHCGWGSCMESISAGVPVAAWPMHSDQPGNATLVTKVLKIGVVVKEWERRLELVRASVVGEVVMTLMASEEGEMMRKRAEELGGLVRQATKEGGVSWLELESFINHITT